jgi:hypothetical protein
MEEIRPESLDKRGRFDAPPTQATSNRGYLCGWLDLAMTASHPPTIV